MVPSSGSGAVRVGMVPPACSASATADELPALQPGARALADRAVELFEVFRRQRDHQDAGEHAETPAEGHQQPTAAEADRVTEIVDGLGFPVLAQNMRDTEWDEPAFKPYAMYERGGVKIWYEAFGAGAPTVWKFRLPRPSMDGPPGVSWNSYSVR